MKSSPSQANIRETKTQIGWKGLRYNSRSKNRVSTIVIDLTIISVFLGILLLFTSDREGNDSQGKDSICVHLMNWYVHWDI